MSTTPKEGTGAPEGAAPAGGAPAGGAPAGAAPAKPKLVGGLSFSAGPAAPAGKLGGGLTFGAAAPPACTHDDHAGHDHSHGGHDHAHAHAERAVGKRPAESGGPAIQLDLEALLPGETDETGRFEELDRALSRIPGVDAVHLRKDGAWPEVCLHYDPVTVTPEALVAAARTSGARVAKRFVQRTWFVVGMDSAQCGEVIEHVLGRTPGVLSAEVAYAAERLVVELDTELLSEKELVRKVEAIGYSLEEVVAGHACSHHGHDCGLAPKNGLNLVWGAGALILVGWALTLWVDPRLGNVAWAAALGCAGFYPIRSAFNAVRAGRIDIETLMVLAAGGAGLMGAWFEGAFLLFLFSLGHALEHRAMDRARKAVEALADLRPPTARVRRGVDVVEVPAEQVRVGDRVVVRPGDRVPVDGRIRDGRSTLDQAAITGESVPVAKAEGDDVFAGTINVDGALEVEATRLASDSTLARAVDLVAQAEARKPPAQRFTARIERMLVPMVLTAAPTLSLSLWWMGTPPTEAALRGISLLVAASPCALAVAVPSAVLSSVARAARAGVLIKGGVHLDALGTLRTVAFDKTGTLTVGKPRLVAVLPHTGTTEATLLQVAASAEALSGHPLAKAIVDGAAARALPLLPASDLDAVHGKGLRAVVDGAPVVIGNAALFDAARVDGALPPEVTAEVDRLHNDGVSTMIVARAGVVLGVLGVADTLRPEAAAVVAQLRGLGVDRVLMLSGDHARVAARVGAEVKVDEVRAPLLPEEKLRAIRQLARHGGVAMVGDGVNDAPALASAGVGVAMGGAGSDVALQSADVVLMADDLRRLPLAVALSRDAARVIRQNVALALGVAAVLVVASIGGWVQISQAVVLHEGSTLLVVLNGIRLLWWREPAPPAGELRGA